MFAVIASFVFIGAVIVAASAAISTISENRSRITAALQGQALPRLRPILPAAV